MQFDYITKNFDKSGGYVKMNIKAELAHTRMLAQEINRVSGKNLKVKKIWEEELRERIKEGVIEKLELTNGEKEMAEFYYYKGENWNYAYNHSELYDNDETSKNVAPCEAHRKNIMRKIDSLVETLLK